MRIKLLPPHEPKALRRGGQVVLAAEVHGDQHAALSVVGAVDAVMSADFTERDKAGLDLTDHHARADDSVAFDHLARLQGGKRLGRHP